MNHVDLRHAVIGMLIAAGALVCIAAALARMVA